MHIKCTYNGVQLSETEFPKNWLTDGIQIKILFPFRLKPWHKSKLQKTYNDPMKKKGQKNDFCFLTVWGMETELPFGSPQNHLSVFEPIFKELNKKIRKWKKQRFLVLRILQEKTKIFLNVSKDIKNQFSKTILFLKEIVKELEKINPTLLFGLRELEIYQLSETKKEKDSIRNNQLIHESFSKIRPTDCTNYSLTKKKIQNLTDRTNTLINQIEKIKKENKKEFIIQNISSNKNKMSYDDKRLESPKNIGQVLKRRNARLIRKSHYFINFFFIEKIYIDIFLGIIDIRNINAQFFQESTKKILNKYIYNDKDISTSNNETNQKRIYRKNKSLIHFISTIKKSLSTISNKSAQTFFDLSYVSQAYVFYKLSQPSALNLYLYKLRSVFQYNGTAFFLKNEIKNYFGGTQKLFHSKLRHNSLRNSGMNQWKNWLKGHDQYDLSQIKWSSLVPQKWRNRVNQHSIAQTNHLKKCDSYENEKNRLIHYEKQKTFEAASLQKETDNFKKHYRYDFLAYKFISSKSINYEDQKNSSIYGLPLQVNNNQEIFYNYSTHKRKYFNVLGDIPINNYLVEDDIIDMEKNPDRKYFDWIILNFCLRKKVDIEAWINIDTDTTSNKYSKTRGSNYQLLDKTDTQGLFYLTIPQNQEINLSNTKKNLFDWMGMNEEIRSCAVSNLDRWFFPEFLILYNTYKIKPWAIPIKLILFNLNINENASENKSITGKQKRNISIFSNEKKSLESENRNQVKKESASQADFESSLSKQDKDIEEDFVGSDMKKDINKKQYKNNTEAGFDFFLKRYLRFQLRWDGVLNKKMIDNIKVYCLLLRLINPREIFISSIQRGELSLDILLIQKDLTLIELTKKGILIIDPIRLSIKNEGQFILYQAVGISLVHKSKHEINQKYLTRSTVDNKNYAEFIAKYQKMTGNKDNNHYDLFVPENILSPRRRRELRILICLNSRNGNGMPRNAAFCNGKKENSQVLDKSKRDTTKLIKLKLFLWPNYRFEDLACMNRYWFDTHNGSRFSLVRIHMYPRFKIR